MAELYWKGVALDSQKDVQPHEYSGRCNLNMIPFHNHQIFSFYNYLSLMLSGIGEDVTTQSHLYFIVRL